MIAGSGSVITDVIWLEPELVRDHEILFDAAERWPVKVLREFIKQGADANFTHELAPGICHTPIYSAIRGFHVGNAELLLAAGADPFVGNAIKFLVNDGIHQKPRSRLKILGSIIEAGFDINAELEPMRGNTDYCYRYNLYAHAVNCDDQEVVKFLNKNGGEPFEVETGGAEPPPFNLETIQRRLVTALRKGWAVVKRERKAKGESFYLFGIATDSDCQTVIPICNTNELAKKEMGKILEESQFYKYSPQEFKALYGAGSSPLEELALEISGRDFRRHGMKKLLKVFEGALAELDDKTFFGTGKNRNKILLMISFSDPDEKEEKIEQQIIRRLNPKEAYKAYFDLLKTL